LEAVAEAREQLLRQTAGMPPLITTGVDKQEFQDPLDSGWQATLPLLDRELSDGEVRVRLASLYVLETLGAKAAPLTGSLVKALRTDTSAYVRWGAARALSRIAPLEAARAVPELARALEDASGDVRVTVVAALEHYGSAGKAAIPALAKVVDRGDPPMRVLAIHALVAVGGKDQADVAVPALVTALSAKETEVRAAAARALARFGPAAGKAREALASGLDDPDSEVRRAAGEALLAIGTP